MAYNNDLVWSDVSAIAETLAGNLKDALFAGLEGKNEWDSLRGTMTNAQLAAQLGCDEADCAMMETMYSYMQDLFQIANGADPSAYSMQDRFDVFRKFT